MKQLFVETKRHVLLVLRIQNGKNLLDILEAPTTQREEQLFAALIEAEGRNVRLKKDTSISGLSQSQPELSGTLSSEPASACASTQNLAVGSNGALISPASVNNVTMSNYALYAAPTVTFATVKKWALENMAKLEEFGKVSKDNYYQDMLTAIAKVHYSYMMVMIVFSFLIIFL